MDEMIKECKILIGIPERKSRLDGPVLLGRVLAQQTVII
jgi:hypothetical protein